MKPDPKRVEEIIDEAERWGNPIRYLAERLAIAEQERDEARASIDSSFDAGRRVGILDERQRVEMGEPTPAERKEERDDGTVVYRAAQPDDLRERVERLERLASATHMGQGTEMFVLGTEIARDVADREKGGGDE